MKVLIYPDGDKWNVHMLEPDKPGPKDGFKEPPFESVSEAKAVTQKMQQWLHRYTQRVDTEVIDHDPHDCQCHNQQREQ